MKRIETSENVSLSKCAEESMFGEGGDGGGGGEKRCAEESTFGEGDGGGDGGEGGGEKRIYDLSNKLFVVSFVLISFPLYAGVFRVNSIIPTR
jgi:hypothetical protein